MKPENIIQLQQEKPIRADAARNRRLLMDTANYLFEAEGVETVTMSAIAQEAGVGKGTLYRHFADKADLCHALLDEDMRDFQHATLTMLRQTADATKALKWFLRHTVEYVVGHSALLHEAARQGQMSLLHHPAHLWWRQTIHSLLTRLQPAGDIEYLTDTLYVMLDVGILRYQRRGQDYDTERIVAGLHMLLDKLLAEHS